MSVHDKNILILAGDSAVSSENIPGYSFKRYSMDYTAIKTASLTNTVTLVTLPAGSILSTCIIKHSIAFVGTGIASNVCTVNGFDTVLGSLVLTQAVSGTAYLAIDVRQTFGALINADLTATNPITIGFVATGGGHTLNDLTAGSLDVWLETYILPS